MVGVGVNVNVVVCVLFENCTVDASIFVVSNEERTVDALAPGAEPRGAVNRAVIRGCPNGETQHE